MSKALFKSGKAQFHGGKPVFKDASGNAACCCCNCVCGPHGPLSNAWTVVFKDWQMAGECLNLYNGTRSAKCFAYLNGTHCLHQMDLSTEFAKQITITAKYYNGPDCNSAAGSAPGGTEFYTAALIRLYADFVSNPYNLDVFPIDPSTGSSSGMYMFRGSFSGPFPADRCCTSTTMTNGPTDTVPTAASSDIRFGIGGTATLSPCCSGSSNPLP